MPSWWRWLSKVVEELSSGVDGDRSERRGGEDE